MRLFPSKLKEKKSEEKQFVINRRDENNFKLWLSRSLSVLAYLLRGLITWFPSSNLKFGKRQLRPGNILLCTRLNTKTSLF